MRLDLCACRHNVSFTVREDSTKSKQGRIRLNQQYCVFVNEQMGEEEPGESDFLVAV